MRYMTMNSPPRTIGAKNPRKAYDGRKNDFDISCVFSKTCLL